MKEDGKMKKTIRAIVLLAVMLMFVIQIPACVNGRQTDAAIQGASIGSNDNCRYKTHVQNIGWQDWSVDGVESGSTEQSLRLEGIKIEIGDFTNLSVTYQTHVQNIGWQDWVIDGAESGTTGQSLRLEAIRINLTGTEVGKYDIYYQVHVQNKGWLPWVKNGEMAGTEGQSLRLEGIKIIVVPQGGSPPDAGTAFKNVILMISDGGAANQILATDYFTSGEAGTQVYEKFPTRLSMSTYSTGKIEADDDSRYTYDPTTIWSSFDAMKSRATDSAAAGTAMSTGIKTYNGAIGVDPNQENLRSIIEDFETQNKSTGVITTVELSHATPASFVAHNINRGNYSEIANEMIKNSAVDVIMGTGNPLYNDNGTERYVIEDSNYDFVGGKETWDGLVAGELGNDADSDGDTDRWTLIQTKAEFEALQTGAAPSRVIGIPQVFSTLQYARDGDQNADPFTVAINKDVPSLATMARSALNVLDNDKDGYFLMIEGGAIDWAASKNQSGRMIEEENDFNQAAKVVCEWVEANSSWSETLVIVTSDHETGYLTGTPGVYNEVINNGQGNIPTMAWNSAEHTNQLVPIFAKGPGADLFKKYAVGSDPVRGAYINNTDIPKVIRELLNSQ